jgi:glutathione S-transferase
MGGTDARQRAAVRMWQRRVEQQIILPAFDAYRWGPAREFFADRGMHALGIPEASAARLATAEDQLRWLDRLMVEAGSPDFICGDAITLPDVQLFGARAAGVVGCSLCVCCPRILVPRPQ